MEWHSDFSMTIGGKGVKGERSIEVVNPATGEGFAYSPCASRDQLDHAVEVAKAAQREWRKLPLRERGQHLARAAAVLDLHRGELGRLFTLEQGRPLDSAMQEIETAAVWLRAVSEMDIPVEVTEDSEVRRIEVHHEPLGVVCAIVPWNFPVTLAIWKIAPALLAGNTMVLKPSPFTPLCTLKIGELFREVFPSGVLNVISGDDQLGPWMTSHPGFAKISFTGSTATGKRVMESAAATLKKVTLELGGNDAAIVLPDVDIDQIAQQIFFGAFFNTAQICVATKRLYVHDSIYDKLRDALVKIAQDVKVGDGSEQGSVLGPVQNRPQYERVLELLEDARAQGLTLLHGSAVPEGNGFFIPVTIVDNPPDESRVVVEEAFGPILPMLRFSEIDDVVARANDSDYGLAGAIWSGDVAKAVEIAHRLETGTVWINENLALLPTTPFGGHKQSGLGVEGGQAGLLEFTQAKAIYIPKSAA